MIVKLTSCEAEYEDIRTLDWPTWKRSTYGNNVTFLHGYGTSADLNLGRWRVFVKFEAKIYTDS